MIHDGDGPMVLLLGAYLLLAVIATLVLLWDNAHAMAPGEEPPWPLGDVPEVPWDVRAARDNARFERMNGVL
ncbi:hypothetical protein ACQR1Y_11985 [Bradyrhizobium sp. HKCCYLRH3099]|uniref:hypothetical protein n=1 Tax=unclassified Bradyrhizobium TaxID=2631580 RepID=UPI003EC09CD4